MELISRTEKHKVEKRKVTDVSWLLGILLFGCLAYPISSFVQIPDDLAYKQTMQILLFMTSLLFLILYLLAFIVASTKTFVQIEHKVIRVNYMIMSFWVLSLLYHFTGWLMSYASWSPLYYKLGVAFTLTVLILTLLHFAAYFSFTRSDRIARSRKQALEYRQQAFESIQRILHTRQIMLEVMDSNPEVLQMMKWNGFDRQMESWVAEMERFMNMTSFTDQELRNILGVKAWMENLMLIVEQHPMHRGLRKKLN
ncbi:hypothetical protein BEP19_13655 [Ammoniphilus oxalaticus]|uniref:Uncharacterized protein n=1 Tax=Ammoniphilus oxalaticus TaxID=66863 RepID=A0A419SED1_9BACL|nr:hypothetical protein [Ammoniphilus oxalaticus]RKD21678.1 hypothetical protein BEP19_13655 [Ammoniphilus oxalaticus]